MARTKLKYELIDNDTGRTLISGSTSHEVLTKAAQYCRNNDLSYYDVAYMVIRNGAKATVLSTLSGAALQELIEDEEIDKLLYDQEDTSGADYDEW